MATLNSSGAAHARALVASGDVNTSSDWSFSAADGNALLGPNGNDWSNYAKWFMGVDASAPRDTKDHYKYPFGKGGKVYRSALTAIRQRAGQQNDTAIFGAAGALIEKIDAKSIKSQPMTRAWSTLVIKSVDESTRAFEGIASTPSTDRMGDVVEPKGAQFKLPIPFLYQHDSKRPIGQITSATVKSDGIYVKGYVEKLDGPPTLKERLDVAWAEMKSKLVRGLSIGFNPIKSEPVNPKSPFDGTRFLSWDWLELSAVTIPAQQDASITAIKSLDRASLAASGQSTRPGVSGQSNSPRQTMKSIQDQLAELGEELQQKNARIDELKGKCNGNPDDLEPGEQEELDVLGEDLIAVSTKMKRLNTMSGQIERATPVSSAAGSDPQRASRVRQGDFSMKSSLPKGILPWTCAVIMKARAIKHHRSMTEAAEMAKREWPGAPEIAAYLKADPGTGITGNWADDLNTVNTVEGQFLELLRPATIIGRLGLRPAPFNVKMIRQTSGSTAAWVGKAAAKPVGELGFDTVQVDQAKIAGIIVLTDDQIMTSHIDSVAATQGDLVNQIAQFADEQATDPTVSAVSNVNPASLTNGVNDIVAGGTTADDLRHDLFVLLNRFAAANMGLSGITLVMSSFVASGASMLVNALGQAEFPDINVDGGTLRGFRVIVSDNVGGSSTGSNIIAVKPSEVLLAQNGGVRVDMSRDATIDMAGGNSPTYSLFQKNSVALRAEWWVSWTKARAEAVQYISGAAYAPAAGA